MPPFIFVIPAMFNDCPEAILIVPPLTVETTSAGIEKLLVPELIFIEPACIVKPDVEDNVIAAVVVIVPPLLSNTLVRVVGAAIAKVPPVSVKDGANEEAAFKTKLPDDMMSEDVEFTPIAIVQFTVAPFTIIVLATPESVAGALILKTPFVN